MSAEAREELFQINKRRLEAIAWRAQQKGMKSDDVVVVAIDVDDPSWTEVVDLLMPNEDWQKYRDRGQKPIARGSVRAEIIDYIGSVVPDIVAALVAKPPEGVVRAIIMGDGGASVYYVQPAPEDRN